MIENEETRVRNYLSKKAVTLLETISDFRTKILFLVLLLTGSLAQAEERRPNILIFFADDWGHYASIYADADKPSLNDVISTPNIDRIAREGVVFENAFVPVASCGPCRASLATGRYFWNWVLVLFSMARQAIGGA